MDNYKQLVKQNILKEKQFIKASFTGQQRGQTSPWKRVTIRPILLKEERQFQISQFDDKKDVTKNFLADQIDGKLDEILTLPFKNIHLQMENIDLQIQISKRGKALIHRHKTHKNAKPSSLNHDRQKSLLLPSNTPDPFLETIGIMTKDGKVRANRQGKFKQINEFLKLILETAVFEKTAHSPLRLVDCGCGNAYLTFAVFYYLNHILNIPTQMTGIDVTQALLDRRTEQTKELGWEGLTFQQSSIIDYEPAEPPMWF